MCEYGGDAEALGISWTEKLIIGGEITVDGNSAI